MRYGFKISGCFGDVLYSTPVLKYLSKCHNDRLDVETNYPDIFINNPHVGKIYDTKLGQVIPYGQEYYDCNGHNFGEVQKQIRKMHLTDYWSTQLGFILNPKEKTLEFYPSSLDIEIPKDKYIIINPSKTWECRTWPKEKWEKLIENILNLGIKVVVTGQDIKYNKNDIKTSIYVENSNVINLVNKLTLSQLWYIINNSIGVITMNAGLLPFAGTTDAFIIEMGGAIDPTYRTPWRHGTQDYKHKFVGGSCKLFCQSDMKYNSSGDIHVTGGFPEHGCFENKPTFECQPSVNAVYNAILELIIEQK